LVYLRQSNLVSTYLIFVPNHTGIRGNERADRLAGTAVISDVRKMEHADVLHALCVAGRVDDSLRDNESNTIYGWSD
jgi:hypothetical protein